MKNSLLEIHNIGNKIRNSGKSIKDKDEMAYKWAIANINSPNIIMKIQALSIIDLYENKYKKNNDNLLDIDYIKKELKQFKEHERKREEVREKFIRSEV